MAISSDTIWEVRQAGSLSNGGGFSAAFGGTDYSQQNTPQLSVADAACANTTTLTSVAGGFTSAMRGNIVNILTIGRFQITAFTNANTVTIDRAGGTFSGKTANVGGATTISTTGLTDIPAVTGNKAWLKADADYRPTVTAPASTVDGTVNLPVVYEGYGLTRGDGLPAKIRYSSGAFGVLSVTHSNNIWKNVIFDGNGTCASTLVTTSGTFDEFYNCTLQNGAAQHLSLGGTAPLMKNCQLLTPTGTADNATVNADGAVLIDTTIAGSGSAGSGIGLFGTAHYRLINCTVRNSINEGVYIDTNFNGSAHLYNCNVWNNGRDGLRIYSTTSGLRGVLAQNCIFGRNGAYDVDYIPSDQSAVFGTQEMLKAHFDHNAFYTTGTGRYHNLPIGSNDLTLNANPFVDDTVTFNFGLNGLAGGGAVLQASPWRPVWADGVNVGTFVNGALGATVAATAAPVFNQAAPVIDEIRFPDQISRGMQGGPSYSTVVVACGGGSEQRVGLWTRPRYRYEIDNSPKQPAEMQAIINFFHARKARLLGFRFKDWSDFAATNEPLTATGALTVQLIKTYASGPSSVVRNIYKPVASPAVTLQRNGSPYLTFALDTTTGLVTLTADSTATITAITQAATAQVTTSAAHGFSAGQTVFFSGVVGMTGINGLTGVIQTTPTGTTFTVNIATTTFSAYSSGGVASKFVQPGESLTWTGQFDVPVRFDVDELKVSFDDPTSWSLDNVPIVEVRTTT